MVLFVLLTAAGLPECGASRPNAAPKLSGAALDVVGDWDGTEAVHFRRVLDRFAAETGAVVRYISAQGRGVPAVVDERVAAGHPPDVAVLPQPALIARYARAGLLQPLDAATRTSVAQGYGQVWQDLGSVDGRLYGVWFKAAHKSLVWYSIGLFERAGIVPPSDLAGLLDRARTLAADGIAPFSVSGGEGWTLTDWFENVYLQLSGPQRYDELAAHRIPWTDPSVVEALRTLNRIFDPALLLGGNAGTLGTSFADAVAALFTPAPRAAMFMEGDFVPAVAGDAGGAEIGVDVDVFPFPSGPAGGRAVVGAGDAAVVMRPGRAAQALVRYLAGPEAGSLAAAGGGFVSPNQDVDLAVYPDDVTRSIARRLLAAGDDFRFDLSDVQPITFGSTDGTGMPGLLQHLLAHPDDVEATAARLETSAAAADLISGR